MQKNQAAVVKDIVLVGGGHSHVGVLRQFAMHPMPGVRLTLICTDTHTPYSGMLPGYIAGHYSYDEVHLDLRRLATNAGARYFHDEVIGLDREGRSVLCRNRPPVPYDVVSINTGSTPIVPRLPGAVEGGIPVKPIRRFNERWLALLEKVRLARDPVRVAVVGGGAGGVELLLSMQYRLHQECQKRIGHEDAVAFDLFSAEDDVLTTHNPRVRRMFRDILQQRGVRLHLGRPVQEAAANHLSVDGEQLGPFDEVVWATQAGGAAWLRKTDLELDERGFLRVNDRLQSLTDPLVFAAGDVASMANHALEKAGVFAVRQGMPLAENLRRSVLGQALKAYRPQSRWLALIGTGGRHAVASRGIWGFQGRWVWDWKERIDRRFMALFTDLSPMTPSNDSPGLPVVPMSEEESAQAIAAQAMRCGGCGAKVGASVLSRALGSLHIVPNPDVVVGLDAPDDAAVVRVPPGHLLVHSVDFFRAFIDDPFVFGRIAANHALGDIYAMGAAPHTATAVATVPPGLEVKVEDTVRQMMSGAVDVLNQAGCTLVGGHTGEGQELALGFAINGLLSDGAQRVLSKGAMRPGERLILTKPVGTGVIMAAHARMLTRGRWVDEALVSMQRSNREAVACLLVHGVTACTDLTGFGLLGHALEMAKASTAGIDLWLSHIPLLDGALDLANAGVMSSLQPANVRLRRAIANQETAVTHPVYPLVFDPQTAGGLLASVPAEQAAACVAALRALGYTHAAEIGEVVAPASGDQPMRLVV